MLNPTAPDASARVRQGFGERGLRCACLFPAMHGFVLDDERVVPVFEGCGRAPVRGVRALRRPVGRRPAQAGSAVTVRHPEREPARPRPGRLGVPRCAGRRSPLRRRFLPRDPHGGRPLPKPPRRYVKFERLDEVHARPAASSTCSAKRSRCSGPSGYCSGQTPRSSHEVGNTPCSTPNARRSMRLPSTPRAARPSSPATLTASSAAAPRLRVPRVDTWPPRGHATRRRPRGGERCPARRAESSDTPVAGCSSLRRGRCSAFPPSSSFATRTDSARRTRPSGCYKARC